MRHIDWGLVVDSSIGMWYWTNGLYDLQGVVLIRTIHKSTHTRKTCSHTDGVSNYGLLSAMLLQHNQSLSAISLSRLFGHHFPTNFFLMKAHFMNKAPPLLPHWIGNCQDAAAESLMRSSCEQTARIGDSGFRRLSAKISKDAGDVLLRGCIFSG